MKIAIALLAVITFTSVVAQDDSFPLLTYPTNTPVVWTNTAEFAQLITTADRLVVRDGGYNCCGSVDNQPQLIVLTNVQSIADLNSNIQFRATQKGLGGCMCCGYPGVDWYKGTNRLALTAIQHGDALRWKGFPGDAQLTPQSSSTLAKWLLDHGVPDRHGELKKILEIKELPTMHLEPISGSQ